MVINTGIIGYGAMAEHHHARVLSEKSEQYRFVSVFDPTSSRRKAAEQRHGVTAFDDIDRFLAQDLDLVIVATPTRYHAQSALAAIRAGKHVVMEKPMGMNADELGPVIDEARKANVTLTVHHNRRRDPDYLAVKKIIADGTIGSPLVVESKVNGIGNPLGAGAPDYMPDWRLQEAYGGGKINEWGSHLIDQALQMFGYEIDYVWGHLVPVGLSAEVDTYGKYAIRFATGVLVQIETSWISPFPEPRWYVLGSGGAVIKQTMAKDEPVTVITRDAKTAESGERSEVPCKPSSHDGYYDDLYRTIADGGPLDVKPEEGAMVIRVIDAVRLSSRTGEVVRF